MAGSILLGITRGVDHFYVCSGVSTTFVGSFAAGAEIQLAQTVDSNGNLIADFGDDIHIYEGLTPTFTGSFAAATSDSIGLGFSDGNLYIADRSTPGMLWQHSGVSNVIIGSWDGLPTEIFDIDISGTDMFATRRIDDTNQIVWKMSLGSPVSTSTVVGSIITNAKVDLSLFLPVMALGIGSSGNLLMGGDSNLSGTEDITIFEFEGYSNTILGSVAYGFDSDMIGGLSYIEQGDGPIDYTEELADAGGIADSIARITQIVFTMSDSINIADSFTSAHSATRVFSDLMAITDNISTGQINLLSLSDSIGILDNLSTTKTILLSLSEALSITDSLLKKGEVIFIADDSINISDSLGRQVTFKRELTELVGILDNLTKQIDYTQELDDIVNITDQLSRQVDSLVDIADNMIITDVMTVVSKLVSKLSELYRLRVKNNDFILEPQQNDFKLN